MVMSAGCVGQMINDQCIVIFQVDLVERREEIEEGFGVVLSDEFPAIAVDNRMKFSSVG